MRKFLAFTLLLLVGLAFTFAMPKVAMASEVEPTPTPQATPVARSATMYNADGTTRQVPLTVSSTGGATVQLTPQVRNSTPEPGTGVIVLKCVDQRGTPVACGYRSHTQTMGTLRSGRSSTGEMRLWVPSNERVRIEPRPERGYRCNETTLEVSDGHPGAVVSPIRCRRNN